LKGILIGYCQILTPPLEPNVLVISSEKITYLCSLGTLGRLNAQLLRCWWSWPLYK